MELREYLKATGISQGEFAEKIGRAQSIVSRLINHRHRPDPQTAVRIVVKTRGRVSLDDLFLTPARFRADYLARYNAERPKAAKARADG